MLSSCTNKSGVSLNGLECRNIERIAFHTLRASFWNSSNLKVYYTFFMVKAPGS